MNAWVLDQISSVDALQPRELPDPVARPGEAILQVEFAALNPADRYLAEGQYPAKPTWPHVLGRDAVGTIAAVGPGVSGLKVGDRRILLRSEVGVNRPGTFAQKVAVPVESLAPAPPDWTLEQCAGAALVYLTAWQSLTMWGPLPPGVVLVTGASGGVGVACVQIAKAMGHTVVALSRDPIKSDKLRGQGADFTLDPQPPAWRKTLKTLLPDRKVDLAIDNIGGPLLPQVLETLGENGKVSCVGRLAGPVPEFNTASLFFRRLRLGGVMVGSYTPAEAQEAWRNVVATLASARALPVVDSVWPFESLKQAFAHLAKGPMGKVILKVKPT